MTTVGHSLTKSTTFMLALGIIAGPFYVAVGLLQMLTREGFDPSRHALSLLSNGDAGWLQVSNFIVAGALVIAGAIGSRQALRSQRAGTWGPVLLGLYGIGLIASGIFPPDPAQGFPPGTEAPETLSTSGLLHFAAGGVAFNALIVACFVFARRFFADQSLGLAWTSIMTGAVFFIAFAAIASGSASAIVIIAFYVAIAWVWAWHTLTLAHIKRTVT